MIQIQGRQQFERAAERIQRERMGVRRLERGAYAVENKAKRTAYTVRFARDAAGRTFGECSCEAGSPTRRGATPMICKHLLAAAIVHNALNAMRRAASAH